MQFRWSLPVALTLTAFAAQAAPAAPEPPAAPAAGKFSVIDPPDGEAVDEPMRKVVRPAAWASTEMAPV